MSDHNKNAATSTAVAKPQSVEEVVALLKANESSDDGKPQQDGGNSQPPKYPAWVGYRSPKTKSKLDELQAAGVAENAFYLYDNGVIAPKPFYVHLISSYKFYSKVDNENNVLAVSNVINSELKAQKFAEHLLAVVLVRLPGATPYFKAATFSQRSGMTRALNRLREIMGEFEKDKTAREWKVRGTQHAAAFDAAKWPAFAVRAKLWGKVEVSNDGNEYNVGVSQADPTPLDDVAALNRYVGLVPETYAGENKKNTELAAALAWLVKRRGVFVNLLDKATKPVPIPRD